MSFRTSSNRVMVTALRSHFRVLSTTPSVTYPRMSNNRFSPSSEVPPSTSASTSIPSSSTSQTEVPSKFTLPDQTFEDADYDPKSALASAKERAWYLDDETPSSSSSTSQPLCASTKAQPNFVTFDPTRTTSTPSSASSRKIQPLPSDAPEDLATLHQFLTSREAAYVLDTSSVVFLNTKHAGKHMLGEGEVIKVEGVDVGAPVWKWIVVCVVKGRGKGVVGRAERALRVWVSL